MNFAQASSLATAWVDIVCEGKATLVLRSTIAKPYGWVFFYQSRDQSEPLAGNAPIIVDRDTLELRETGTARPLEHYLEEYERSIPSARLQRVAQQPSDETED